MFESFKDEEKLKQQPKPSPENGAEGALEKMPDHFDAAIILGKNWRSYISPQDDPSDLELSVESKMSALAGAEMLKAELTGKIIISGGKTAGQHLPSETAAMKDYILHMHPEISADSIQVEESSLDTHENADRVLEITQKYNLNTLALVTVGYHLDRAQRIFENHDVSTFPISSEKFLLGRSSHYERFIENFNGSSHVTLEKTREWLLKNLLIIDPKGKMIAKVTKRFRG